MFIIFNFYCLFVQRSSQGMCLTALYLGAGLCCGAGFARRCGSEVGGAGQHGEGICIYIIYRVE